MTFSGWEAVALKGFRNRYVRDLAWTIGAPPLFVPPSSSPVRWATPAINEARLDQHTAWLRTLDADPSALEAMIATAEVSRLGRYFEFLHRFWFTHGPHCTLLASNVPIRDEGAAQEAVRKPSRRPAVIGELDFIYDDGAGPVHLEVAVKYYLRVAPKAAVGAYIGPSLRDRFDKKLDKLLHHQSQRLHHPGAQAAWRELGLDVRRAEVRLLGALFEPLWPFPPRKRAHSGPRKSLDGLLVARGGADAS